MAGTESAPLVVRRLQQADAAPYRDLMLDAHASAPEAFTTSHAERAAQPLSWWQARLGTDPNAVEAMFGATQAGQLLGAVGLRRDPRQNARHKATVFGLFVRPVARGQGVAHRLMTALIEHAQTQAELRQLQLTVTDGNHIATQLYQRCGFASYGVEPMAIRLGDRYLDKRLMWRLVTPC